MGRLSDDTRTRSELSGWLATSEEDFGDGEDLALVVAWSAAEPRRIGEVALLPPDLAEDGLILGRGPDDGDDRLRFCRQRPTGVVPRGPIEGPAISRDQVRIRPAEEGLEVEKIGRCPMLVAGKAVNRGLVRPGETLALKRQLLLYCTRRPDSMRRLRSPHLAPVPEFGQADVHGLVGESPAAWELRDQLAFSAASEHHVLLLGDSGCGKELGARAVHALSRRHTAPMITRNAATFPSGLIDAELFGNAKDYPNAGMEARPGLIGQADGSSLFLDEIAELPEGLQAHLLRVLDRGGEYQRLGDAHVRRSDLRIIAATNRDPSDIKHDLLARFTLRLTLPGLQDRREDIPLLVRHLLRLAAGDNEAIRQRFFKGDEPRIHPDLVEGLLSHAFSHHVRELDRLLWQAISESPADFIALTPGVAEQLCRDHAVSPDDGEPSPEAIRSCLNRHDGRVSRAWPELGLKSRYALYRLMKKHHIVLDES